MERVIAVFGKSISSEYLNDIESLFSMFVERGFKIVCESNFAHHLVSQGVKELLIYRMVDSVSLKETSPEILLSIGGDGTFLGASAFVGDSGIPIIGVNCGRLGFLANIATTEMKHAVEDICNRNYTITERTVLRLETETNGMKVPSIALNEVSVQKSSTASLLNIKVNIDGQFLTTYWADGLVISTPTGSTAYSMSAGGPIVTPECQVLLLTPVCPHNLTLRPMVVSMNSVLEIKVESRSGDFIVSADSKIKKCTEDVNICVHKNNYAVNVVQLPGMNFYDTLRKKLYWGEDTRNLK